MTLFCYSKIIFEKLYIYIWGTEEPLSLGNAKELKTCKKKNLKPKQIQKIQEKPWKLHEKFEIHKDQDHSQNLMVSYKSEVKKYGLINLNIDEFLDLNYQIWWFISWLKLKKMIINFQIQIVKDEKDDNNEFLNSNKLKRRWIS